MENDFILDQTSRKMLDALFQNPEYDFNKAELAREADVSRDALYRRWDVFEKLDMVQKTEEGYRLNRDAHIVHSLQVIAEEAERVRMSC